MSKPESPSLGINMLGATEATEEVLKKFRQLISSAKDVWGLLEALDYLEASLAARPFSAPLINASRELLTVIAHGEYDNIPRLKELVEENVEKLLRRMIEETEAAAEIAARRLENGDTVLTHSYSRSVLRTIEKAVAMGKTIRVIVAESRPVLDGIEMAKALTKLEIDVTLIVDSAMRFMAREATKALIGADAVTADGSIIARTGAGLLALAANESRVRVIVVAGTYKFYPETVYGLMVESPALQEEIVPESHKKLGIKGYAPLFEFVPPHLIDALATEKGLIAPEAVPLLVKEEFGEWPPRLESLEKLFTKAREELKKIGAKPS
ncbi:translation initiation factor eIF-2B [Hyperthermus butylicus]|uniref:Translation initiation factor eIF2B subunit beta n=1 Tax=Hyperthermus butylicus (strain DSM 5456 / JCM 9403 / PLM1-5) TaxID=415426 RepID=A2BK50_HYPBU|nr:translation initiation factor eIF-2B [Hyperthermus butylicus]ABM80361.1 putative translation initiation factor eIF-2B subunit 2 [Hyperthermus butylicus DSM 5456]